MSDNDELEISSKTLIVEDNFRINRSGAPGRYDLYIKKIVNKGKKIFFTLQCFSKYCIPFIWSLWK